MQWTDNAIVLSTRKHGEEGVIATLFTEQYGLYSAMVRSSHTAYSRSTFQTGNRITVTWKARLPEHLGHFTAELLEPVAANLMADRLRLTAVSSLAGLLEKTLPERMAEQELYHKIAAFFSTISQQENWLYHYLTLEKELLGTLGFALDLERCAATGSREDLCYISPKSGRAVSRLAGEPYKDKLLPFPPVLSPDSPESPTGKAIAEALGITGYFLEKWCLKSKAQTPLSQLPQARQMLLALVG